jgi:hypothetical protein
VWDWYFIEEVVGGDQQFFCGQFVVAMESMECWGHMYPMYSMQLVHGTYVSNVSH